MRHILKINKRNYEFLDTESKVWVNSGLITDNQRQSIMSAYDQENLDQVARNRLTLTMAVLGALLVGVGVIMFFASNWQALGKTTKLIIIFGALIVSYGTGYYLAYWKATYPRVGHSLIFLGSVLFGAAIHLIAQIFHIEAHYPNGVLFWALGILPLAWVVRSKPILWEATALITLWVNLEVQGFENLTWLFWPILLIGVLPLIYKLESVFGLLLGLVSMYLWVAQTNIWWIGWGLISPAIVALIGFAVYLLGTSQFVAKINGFQACIQEISLIVSLIALFVMTFDVLYWSQELNVPVSFYASLLLALTFLLIVSFGAFKAGHNPKEIMTLVAFSLVVVAGTFVWIVGLDNNIAIFSYNLILFGVILWSIYQGYITQRPFMVNVGLVAFVIDLIARYFDFLWELLDKSLFFILGGLLLLIGGSYLEKKRRQMLQQMGGSTYEQA